MPQVSSVQSGTQYPVPEIAPHGSHLYFDSINEYRPEQGHYVEESVLVYLRLDDKSEKWIVDGSSIDGCALDTSNEDYPFNGDCTCENEEACTAALEHARKTRVPTGDELMHMLAEALGYTLTKKETI
ncbi:hypothetical protein QNA23_10705 [Rhodococcus erythropolis]|uniref:hypothetical protein n=1 Tax=Rhodococcus erythropolis TaxID=1833 RepID=UPI0024B8A602|nr:hypothetical protein [Rhodococcus erythropolis]MDJ0403952.1 hypothetical protein [Rhodococcus erythropolis]